MISILSSHWHIALISWGCYVHVYESRAIIAPMNWYKVIYLLRLRNSIRIIAVMQHSLCMILMFHQKIHAAISSSIRWAQFSRSVVLSVHPETAINTSKIYILNRSRHSARKLYLKWRQAVLQGRRKDPCCRLLKKDHLVMHQGRRLTAQKIFYSDAQQLTTLLHLHDLLLSLYLQRCSFLNDCLNRYTI